MAFISSISRSTPSRAPSFAARLIHSVQLMRTRRALKHLGDAALRDVGISRQDALQEAARPFWDAPHTWRD